MSMTDRNIKRMREGTYRIRFKYRDPLTGRQRVYQETMTGATPAQARARRDEARAECLRARHSIDRSLRLRDCVASYQAARVHRDPGRRQRPLAVTTLELEARILDTYVTPAVGDWLVCEVTWRDLDEQVRRWSVATSPSTGRPYAASSVNAWVGVLRRLVQHAALMANVDDPTTQLKGVVQPRSKVARALTADEAIRVLAYMREHERPYYAMTYLALVSAARSGEVGALHWDQVDRAGGVIHLDHTVRGGRRRKATKTGHVTRVPLLDELVDILDEHKAWLEESRHPRRDSGVVFPSRRGRAPYICNSTYNYAVKRVADNLEIEPFRPHDLRHTANTLMLSEGVTQRAVRALTGHASEALTQHYDHPGDLDRRAAAGTLLRVLNGGKGQRGVNEGATPEHKEEDNQGVG